MGTFVRSCLAWPHCAPWARLRRSQLGGRRGVLALVRGWLLLGASLLGFAVLAPSGEARMRHKTRWRCEPGRMRAPHPSREVARLLLIEMQAQVYEVYERPEDGEELSGGEQIFGCIYGSSRMRYLGFTSISSGSGGAGAVSWLLAGTNVALVDSSWTSSGPPNQTETVSVRSLRTDKLLHRWETLEPLTTTSVVLKPDGAVAWITTGRYPDEPRIPAVYSMDSNGTRLVATGHDIDTTSLALAGSTIYWTQGGKPFSAPLN